MNIAILGAGALGSLYGAFCAEAGHDVVLVGRLAHVSAVRAHGLTVRQPDGAERVVGLTVDVDAAAADGADIVVVACKAQDTAGLLDRHGGSPMAVCSVQNGARQWRPLVERYGEAAVGCSSMVGATLVRPGVIEHTFSGATYLGALATSDRNAVTAVRYGLGPHVDVVERDDITDVVWSKAVLAAAAMGMSLLLRTPYHHVFVEPTARRAFLSIVAEAAAVARAAGATLVDLPGPLQAGSLVAMSTEEALDRLAEVGAAMVGSGQTSVRVSMLQSLESGRRLEIGAVFGDLLDVADELGLAVPVLRTVADVAATLDALIAKHELPTP